MVTVINHLANGQTIKKKIRTNFVYLGDFMDQVYEEFGKSPFQLKPLYLISSQGNKLYLQPDHTLKQIFDNYDCPINVEFSPDVEDWDEDRTTSWLDVVGLPTESLKLTGKDLLKIQKVEDLDKYESLSKPDKKLLFNCIDRLKGSWGWSGYQGY